MKAKSTMKIPDLIPDADKPNLTTAKMMTHVQKIEGNRLTTLNSVKMCYFKGNPGLHDVLQSLFEVILV